MFYNEKIHFQPSDEECSVLVISELDNKFPKHNNLISFIDRQTLLETRHFPIENNFELIIINSLYRPEEIFKQLGKRTAEQVLRRIFNSKNSSKVLEIKSNKEQLNK